MVHYGEGATFYFMFLKYLGTLYVLMFLLSIPSMLIYVSSNKVTISTFLTMFSLGNIENVET
jgi:hypothetical protein